jgi:hypothetical protein
VLTTGIIYNATPHFTSVGAIYDDCSHGIASVINSEGERHISKWSRLACWARGAFGLLISYSSKLRILQRMQTAALRESSIAGW